MPDPPLLSTSGPRISSATSTPSMRGITLVPARSPPTTRAAGRLFEVGRRYTIFGGAAGAESRSLLLAPLQWSHVPGFGAVIFRRTTTQVRAEGGLWDESQEIYSRLNGTPREQQLEWRFPSGAAVSFAHMEWERNRYDWQGSQICLIGLTS